MSIYEITYLLLIGISITGFTAWYYYNRYIIIQKKYIISETANRNLLLALAETEVSLKDYLIRTDQYSNKPTPLISKCKKSIINCFKTIFLLNNK